MIRDELISMMHTIQGFNTYESLSLDTFYRTLSHNVSGGFEVEIDR